MTLIRKILEFDIDTARSGGPVNKRNWGNVRTLIETQLSKITASVWDGMSKHDMAQAISKIIYLLILMTHDSEFEDLVKEYLRTEHRH